MLTELLEQLVLQGLTVQPAPQVSLEFLVLLVQPGSTAQQVPLESALLAPRALLEPQELALPGQLA